MSVTILNGDCRDLVVDVQDASVDVLCCDPPYEFEEPQR